MKSHCQASFNAVAVLLLVAAALPAGLRAAEREKTTAEKVALALSPTASISKRVEAIESLSEISDPTVERDNKVGDALQTIATRQSESIMIRIPAIEALGRLQMNAKRELKDKFLPAFAIIFKDPKEHALTRTAVALVFKTSLDLKGVPDRDAFRALVDVARSKSESSAIRGAAMEAIGTFGSTEGLDVLVTGLTDPDVRDKAAVAIFELLSRVEGASLPVPAINKLIEILADAKAQADLRVGVMKVLAALIRDGNNQSRGAFDEIKKIVGNEPDEKLVEGGIEALGIIGSAEAVEPLKKAYADFMQAAPAAPPAGAEGAAPTPPVVNTKDTRIREAVMNALGSVLATQEAKKLPETKAVHESALLLVKAVDDDPSAQVQSAAVFSMRFLYSKKFKSEHKEVIDALIFKLRDNKTNEEMKLKIAKTLFYITERDFGIDVKRWDDYQKTGK